MKLDWYQFVNQEQCPDKSKVAFRDRIPAVCQTCGTEVNITRGNLHNTLKRKGTYDCRSCGAKKSAAKGLIKHRKTMLERYGVENPNQVPEIRARIKKTSIDRYGDGGSLSVAREAFIAKYGVDNPFKVPEIQAKIDATMTERYGSISMNLGNLLKRNNVSSKRELFDKLVAYLEDKDTNCSSSSTQAYMQTTQVVLTRLLNLYGRTDLLRKGYFQSNAEKEIYDFIVNELGYEGLVLTGNRTALGGKELDIYLPAINLGIEHNGCYWHKHSILNNKWQHFHKRELAEAKGIRLIQIMEDEWLFRSEIVKSVLSNAILKSNTRYFARKLTLAKVSKLDAIEFLDNNHLMGAFKSGRNIGLYDTEGRLIQIMAYKVYKSGNIHLERICSKRGTTVVGGVSKLLKYVTKNHDYKQVTSFVDLRYATGASLKAIGFELENVSLGFKWVKNVTTYNRRYCRANMDDRNLPEAAHAEELGLDKIYDAGQARWVLKKPLE